MQSFGMEELDDLSSKISDGHYAVLEGSELLILHITHNSTGRARIVRSYLQGEKRVIIGVAREIRILQSILDDVSLARRAYTQWSWRCSICNRRLSDGDSLADGMGPDCARRLGLVS